MKRIEFNECNMCPHHILSRGKKFISNGVYTRSWCSLKMKAVLGVNIPDWCPLPDVEEPKEERYDGIYRCGV